MSIDPTGATANALASLSVRRAAATALSGSVIDTGLDLGGLLQGLAGRPRVEPRLATQIAGAAAKLFQGARELRVQASVLTEGDGFEQRAVESGDGAVTGTASNGAAIGEFQVDVVQRAAGQRNNGTRLDPSQNTEIDTGTSTVAIDIDGLTRTVSFEVGVADNNQQALQSFADAINAADSGVTAEVRETNAGEVRIRITRDDTGSEATFDIRDLQGNAVAATGADIVRREARDAEVIVDGQTVTSATNTIDLDGGAVTLEINRVTDGTVTVGVAADTEAQVEFVQGFVNEFSDFRAFLNDSASFMNDQVRRDLDAAVQSQGFELASIGVTRAADGTFQVDEERLNEVLSDDPQRVQDLFTNFNGLATRVGAVAERVATTSPSSFVLGSLAETALRGGTSAFNGAGVAISSPLIAALMSGQLIDALF